MPKAQRLGNQAMAETKSHCDGESWGSGSRQKGGEKSDWKPHRLGYKQEITMNSSLFTGGKNWSVHKIKTHHVLCFKKTHNHSLNRDHLFKWGLPLHTQTLTLINGDYTGKNHNIGDRWRTRWQLSEISANKHKPKKILDYKTLLLDIRQSTYKLANCPITYWFVKWSRQRCNLI